jgi:FAD/FMN-containing dehydrogenase
MPDIAIEQPAAVDGERLRAAGRAARREEGLIGLRSAYSTDASVYQILPLGVVIPKTRDDVIRAVKICWQFGVPITARGEGPAGRTGDWRGRTTRFLKVPEQGAGIEPEAQRVRVEPGIVLMS